MLDHIVPMIAALPLQVKSGIKYCQHGDSAFVARRVGVEYPVLHMPVHRSVNARLLQQTHGDALNVGLMFNMLPFPFTPQCDPVRCYDQDDADTQICQAAGVCANVASGSSIHSI